MNFVGLAKQIVIAAQHILVRTAKEHTQIVRLSRLEFVQWQGFLHVAQVNELFDLAITVASDVHDGCTARRTFVQAVQRHDWKERIYRPMVRQTLEQREIADVLIGQ